MKKIVLLIAALLCSGLLASQNRPASSPSPDLLTREWSAKWIAVPGEPDTGYGVYLFRKNLILDAAPKSFVVHVSADNRYKLYVNGNLVSVGPARGDLFYWNYETIDLAPHLTAGSNTIAAKVWNDGSHRPEAQISWRTGFLLQGNSSAEEPANTNQTWKCLRDTSYQPLESSEIYGYYVAGPGESIDMKKHIRGWEKSPYNDAAWKPAALAHWRGGAPKGIRDASGWMLVPSSLPPMERSVQRLHSTRDAALLRIPEDFPASVHPFSIPAHTKAAILLDNGVLTNAYLTLQFSRGYDAAISLKYAESLYVPQPAAVTDSAAVKIAGKGNRNDVRGKIFLGRQDRIISDGTPNQVFTSLYWRTYRYIQLTVETREHPLIIEDIYGTFTGYPFALNASFASDRRDLQQVLDIGWRTARLCALETYVDCPYYEQLQYIGDARIQALVSLYNSGDDRLMRNALNQMDHSRLAEGLTLSRHPSYSPQIIPTFSLWYIGMLHDYWRYRPDSQFVQAKLPGTRQILDFFHRYQQHSGSLHKVPYWNFTDWVLNRPEWPVGVAPTGRDGASSVLDLQLLLAYQTAAELESALGMEAYARLYRQRAQQMLRMVEAAYWDAGKGLLADTAEKTSYSQHANALAILTGTLSGARATAVARRMQTDTSLAPASIYFKYYLHRALIQADPDADYVSWLDKWRENIAMGMTTWAEDYDIHAARSDCHAWGSSPNIELYRIVLGIDSDSPGFAKVKIEPHLGALKKAGGRIPHPRGMIEVQYELRRNTWRMDIHLPDTLTGCFVWKKHRYALKSGDTRLELPSLRAL